MKKEKGVDNLEKRLRITLVIGGIVLTLFNLPNFISSVDYLEFAKVLGILIAEFFIFAIGISVYEWFKRRGEEK